MALQLLLLFFFQYFLFQRKFEFPPLILSSVWAAHIIPSFAKDNKKLLNISSRKFILKLAYYLFIDSAV